MATAFLLAAGLGTRLRPLTNVRPKPLLPVCGVPMLDHALALVRAHGHERVIVNAHWLWEQVAEWCHHNGCEVQVELPAILGTGGGLRAALDRGALEEVVVVVNADILTNADLSALRRAVPAGGAAMALRASPDAAQIGPVERDASGMVVRITNVVGEPGLPGTHFTGVHAMHRDAVALVPPGFHCVIRTAYRVLVPQRKVGATLQEGLTWYDIGTPEVYLQANLAALMGELALPVDPWSRGERRGSSFVGPGARVDGDIEECVIGAGAVVPPGSSLRRVVVWDGVTVPGGELADAVVYADGSVLRCTP